MNGLRALTTEGEFFCASGSVGSPPVNGARFFANVPADIPRPPLVDDGLLPRNHQDVTAPATSNPIEYSTMNNRILVDSAQAPQILFCKGLRCYSRKSKNTDWGTNSP